MLSWIKQRYHWIIALVMLIELAVVGGMANNYASLYVIPITLDLGTTRAGFSLAISVKSLVSFICTSVSGVVFLRFGTKKSILFGMSLYAAALGALSQSTTITAIAIVSAFAGAAEAFCCTASASRVVGDWFNRFQGTVLGLVSAATGFGGSIMCTVLSSVISDSGWRTSYIVAALIILAAGVLVLIFVRSRPEDMGLTPYGADYKPKKKVHRREDDHWLGYTMQELLRMPIFYLTAAVFFLSAVCLYLAFNMIVPHLQDQGMSAADAATLNSLLMIFLAVYKFLFGALCDVIGPKLVCVICMIASSIGLWLLAGVTGFIGGLIAIMIYAMGLPIVTVTIPLLTYPLFGYRSHSTTLGIFMAMPMLGSLIANPVANAVYDLVGSYSPVFQFASILSVVVIGLYILLYILSTKTRSRHEKASV